MTLEIKPVNTGNLNMVRSLRAIDQYQKTTFDDKRICMTVLLCPECDRIFKFHNAGKIYGWTDDRVLAFENWGNVEIYTLAEIKTALASKNRQKASEA